MFFLNYLCVTYESDVICYLAEKFVYITFIKQEDGIIMVNIRKLFDIYKEFDSQIRLSIILMSMNFITILICIYALYS